MKHSLTPKRNRRKTVNKISVENQNLKTNRKIEVNLSKNKSCFLTKSFDSLAWPRLVSSSNNDFKFNGKEWVKKDKSKEKKR